ncbi:MAG: gene transfer agent family protein [Pseudomonadota bacterium]
MANPLAGEVEIRIGGERRICKLTLGALAELEADLREESLIALIERFDHGSYRAADILAVVVAGLRGGGWEGTRDEFMSLDVDGGVTEAARVAARLLVGAFAPFEQ